MTRSPVGARRRHHAANVRRGERAAVEAEVQIAGAFDGHRLHEHRQRQSVHHRLGELARLPLQRLGQLQAERRGQIAHRQTRRRLQHDAIDGVAEERRARAGQRFGELFVICNHAVEGS